MFDQLQKLSSYTSPFFSLLIFYPVVCREFVRYKCKVNFDIGTMLQVKDYIRYDFHHRINIDVLVYWGKISYCKIEKSWGVKIWNISIDEQFVEGCRIRQLMGEYQAVGPTAFGQSVLCVGKLV